jgi:1-phosphatidylinositol phosphodiesterase
MSYHGVYPQCTPFSSILATLYQFLTANDSSEGTRECIVVSIKQEDIASSLFTSLVYSEIGASPGGRDFWYTEFNRIPTLGEVRGKCVLFSRFGVPGGEGLGIHPDRWPDSQKEGFEWDCGGTLVRVSDWYVLNF